MVSTPLCSQSDRPPSDRILRFTSPTTSLEDSVLYVYDYSSFTSSLTESTRFIYALADFYDDVECEILDTRLGFVTTSIGDLLRSYAQECATFPEFDVARLLPCEGLVSIRQHNCGMLGVPGNLASCTILHAVHLMYLAGSMSSVRCVGDDGLAIVPGVDVESFVDGVNNLGDVAKEKAEFWIPRELPPPDWRQEAWHYVKRPIYRVHDTFIQGALFIFPSLEFTLDLSDQYHRSATIGMSKYERKRRAIRQFMRLWSDLSSNKPSVSDLAISILDDFGHLFYITLELPFGGGVDKGYPFGRQLLVPPRPTGEGWFEDPYQVQLDSLRGQSICVPAMRGFDDRVPDVSQSFVSRSSPILSILESLGVVRKERLVLEEIRLDFGMDAVSLIFLKGEYAYSWEYHVLEQPPDWTY
jgi:hypothetical protein